MPNTNWRYNCEKDIYRRNTSQDFGSIPYYLKPKNKIHHKVNSKDQNKNLTIFKNFKQILELRSRVKNKKISPDMN